MGAAARFNIGDRVELVGPTKVRPAGFPDTVVEAGQVFEVVDQRHFLGDPQVLIDLAEAGDAGRAWLYESYFLRAAATKQAELFGPPTL